MSALLPLAGNVIGGVLSPVLQSALGKQNAEWQWDNYYSPRAQVNNLAEAGINPAIAFGNQSPVLSSGGQLSMPNVPGLGIGTTALSEIGSYLNAKASAAKAEKETGKVDAETQKVLSELDAQRLQNELVRQFGQKKWTYDVALAYENVLLARKSNDIKEQEKAMNEYHKITSYLESQLKGSELIAFKKRLDNLDMEIQLSNKLQSEKIATEKSSQSANYASAEFARANAAGQRILNEVNGSESGKQALLDELEQRARVLKKKGELSDATIDYLSKLAELVEKDADWYEWNQILNSAGKISGIVFDGIDRFTKLGMLKNASRPDLEATEQVRFDKDGNYIGHTETKRVRSKQ